MVSIKHRLRLLADKVLGSSPIPIGVIKSLPVDGFVAVIEGDEIVAAAQQAYIAAMFAWGPHYRCVIRVNPVTYAILRRQISKYAPFGGFYPEDRILGIPLKEDWDVPSDRVWIIREPRLLSAVDRVTEQLTYDSNG